MRYSSSFGEERALFIIIYHLPMNKSIVTIFQIIWLTFISTAIFVFANHYQFQRQSKAQVRHKRNTNFYIIPNTGSNKWKLPKWSHFKSFRSKDKSIRDVVYYIILCGICSVIWFYAFSHYEKCRINVFTEEYKKSYIILSKGKELMHFKLCMFHSTSNAKRIVYV